MSTLFHHIKSFFLAYLCATQGAVIIIFAMTLPVVVMSTGVTVDLAQAYLTRERLNRALDAAALAAAKNPSDDQSVIEQEVQNFLIANYPDGDIGDISNFNVVIDDQLDTLTVTGYASVDTAFMGVIGIYEVDVSATTTVQREVQGIEVVLVLDVTGSMADYIDELEDSVEMFVNRICLEEECPENVKIGYVPFSTAVNVGPYGLGEDESGNFYDAPFVNNPFGKEWGTDFDDWLGCVLAADSGNDTDPTFAGNWNMFRNSMAYAGSWSYFDFESYSHYVNTSWGRYYYYHSYNYLCNSSYITPLTNNKDRLLSKADFNANGWTLGNLGMIWGLRVLTPDYPFTEGSPWEETNIKRVIVMMTDGVNDIPDGGSSSSQYSAYGEATGDGINEDDLDSKFTEVCNTAKNDYEVEIYTITFSDGVDADTEELFEACASEDDNYYDVDSAVDLADAYDDIAKELSNLYVSK